MRRVIAVALILTGVLLILLFNRTVVDLDRDGSIEAEPTPTYQPSFWQALLAGALAGVVVDVVLHPLDTIKTRLQSSNGFWASGGFNGLYSGLLVGAIGSAPASAFFFVAYEVTKQSLGLIWTREALQPLIHMAAASAGEMVACTVRVPGEVIKQRMQAGQAKTTKESFVSVTQSGGIRGLFRGFWTTVAREIPFSCIQFTIYEACKAFYVTHYEQPVLPLLAAFFGSIAGGIAAAITTPLDVAKTRIMLNNKLPPILTQEGTLSTIENIIAEEGLGALWKGVGPRVLWISLGGSLFLGVYEWGLVSLSL